MKESDMIWTPTEESIHESNLGKLMAERGVESYGQLHRWSVENREEFWKVIIDRLGIRFKEEPNAILDLSKGVEQPNWLPGATLNIVDSCFQAGKDKTAIIWKREGSAAINRISYAQLLRLTNRVANGIVDAGFKQGDGLAIAMPMTPESVALYLGIIKAGCVVVSIADSFAAPEIRKRLDISKAKAIFTMDYHIRSGKRFELYARMKEMGQRAIVIPWEEPTKLRGKDIFWKDFLSKNTAFESKAGAPGDTVNILFSSGTTADPKAIPWTQSTPLKCASDGYLHHDIRPGDIICWPTNLGWMMGPWLVYASLINRATIALFVGSPVSKEFGEFVQDARVTMLGVVPILVKKWRTSKTITGLEWSHIRVFSSTGECSNAEDMGWLMQQAGNKPIIEYCGGTEIGGGFLTGTVVQPAYPAMFTTPTLGLDVVILDEGKKAERGELFIIPPSIGLSNTLLNHDHHEVYFKGCPRSNGTVLRRHGDTVERLKNGYFRVIGRIDDTMNLSGIKVSSAEIERALLSTKLLKECAAIAVPQKGSGPEQLIIYAVSTHSREELKDPLQNALRTELNPLFKVHEIKIIEALPRTASGKVMRRVLRKQYLALP